MTLRDTWHAWLGPAADSITDDQLARLDVVAREITTRWPDPDDQPTRDAALSAAFQVIVGDDTLENLADEWRASRVAERERMAALTGALLATPEHEAELVRRTNINRQTIRKALGK